MKLRRTLIASAAAMLTLGIALPATADTATSTATLTITGGTLQISVSPAPVDLGSHPATVDPATISGDLGHVVVTDRRGAPAGSRWVASVTTTAFTAKTGPPIPPNRVSYTAGPITTTGTAHVQANNPTNLRHAAAAVTADNITGNNTATWTPTIHINAPGGLTAGVYTATITHSVT